MTSGAIPSARADAVAAAAFCALCAPGRAAARSKPGTGSALDASITWTGRVCSHAAISREASSSMPITAVSPAA